MKARIVRADARDGASGSARRPNPERARVVRRVQQQARAEAEQLLERARVQAGQLVEQARERAARLERDQQQRARDEAAELLLCAQREAREVVDEAREQLTALGVRIAEKILGEQLSLEPQRVSSIVAQVLRNARSGGPLTVRCHPEDLELLDRSSARLETSAESAGLRLQPDPEVARGGCIVETDRGQLDGRLRAQLATIATALGVEPW